MWSIQFRETPFMTPHPALTGQLSKRHRPAIGVRSWNAAESSIRNRTTARKRKLVGLILPFTLLASQAVAATYPVINLNDAGPGSLREAILSANASKGNTVAFRTRGTIILSSTSA